MAQTISFGFPEILESAIECHSKAFAVNAHASALLLLQMAAAIAGPSIRTASPSGMECTPAYDVAVISGGRAILPGAIFGAFEGARQLIMDAAGAQDNPDRRSLVEKQAALMRRNAEISARIQNINTALDELRGPKEGKTYAELLEDMNRPAQMRNLESQLPGLHTEQGNVQKDLCEVVLTTQCGIIRDSADWRDFIITGGKYSLDGNFFQIATAQSLKSEASSTSNQLRACSELLQQSRSQSSISGFSFSKCNYSASVNLTGSPEEFAALLRHDRLKNLGFLNGFVFTEIDSEQAADANALEEFENHPWHPLMNYLLHLRATGAQKRLCLPKEGKARYLEFFEWCWHFVRALPEGQHVFFRNWGDLAVRMASTVAWLDNDLENGVLELRYLDSAVAFLKDHAARQAAVLGRLMASPAHTSQTDQDVEKLVWRLRTKGGQTRREIVRSYHGQKYSVIDARLTEAIRRGLVVQSDGRFFAATVNVSASAEPEATGFEPGVAA